MSNTHLSRLNALQLLGSVPAGLQARGAAPSRGTTAAPASAGASGTPFAALLSELQALTRPASSSAAAPAATDTPLAEDTAGGTAKASVQNTDLTSSSKLAVPAKGAPKSASMLKQIPSATPAAPPGAAPAVDPAVTAASPPLSPPLSLKLGAGQPAAAVEADAAPARQSGSTYTIEPTAPDLTDLSAAAGQAGAAANASEAALATVPRTLLATGPASAPPAVDPALLAAPPASAPHATTAAAAADAPTGQPSQQVAPALVQLSHAAGGGQLTLQLNPGELGRVHIQIDRAADGSASVHVSADRAETLQLLVADQAQLHHALDSAGLPQDGRTLSLSLATPDTSASDGFSGSLGGGGSFAGEQSSGQQGRPSTQSAPLWASGDEPATWGSGADSATSSITSAIRLRAGVDITA